MNSEIPQPYANEVLRAVIGSTIHGLNVVGTDDLDLMGVCIEPVDAVLGLGKFEQHVWRTQPEGQPSGHGDVDLVVYGLRKYLRLVTNGNPTVTNLLFVPPEHRHIDTEFADALRALTPLLVSRKKTGPAYLGYAEAQRQRLLGLRGGRSVRPEARWVEGTTYDTKYAMHMMRLVMQGVELLETGMLVLPMREEERAYCFAVRMGEVEQAEVIAKTEEYENRLRALIESDGPLWELPDMEAVNRFLAHTYLHTFGS